jgi:RNA polymerase sigma-70 factor, ECF subfamily
MPGDDEIIRGVLAGDLAAFGQLVRRYQASVLRFAHNMIRDRHEAEDLGQEVFVAAYRSLHTYDPGRCQFSTWLLVIARNKCLNLMRKRRPLPMAELPPVAGPQNPDGGGLEGEELMEHLDRALERLPEEQKTAFVLVELVGTPSEEAALIEGVEAGTMRSRLSRAKAALRASLGGIAGVSHEND